MKIKKTLLIIVLGAFVLSGCKEQDDMIQDLKSGEVYIGIENVNLLFDSFGGIKMNSFEMGIVSASELRKEDIKIKDFDGKYTINLSELEKEALEDYVVLAKEGVDWKKYHELVLEAASSANGMNKFSEYTKAYDKKTEEYYEKDIAPSSFYYMLTIMMDINEMQTYKPFSEIEITVNGEPKVFDIGKVSFADKCEDGCNDIGVIEAFSLTALASSGYEVIPNEQGYIQSDGIGFETEDDIEIVSVESLGEDTGVIETIVELENNGEVKNIILGDEPLTLTKNSKGVLYVTIEDENFKDKTDYLTQVSIKINIRKGNVRSAIVYNMIVQTRPSYTELIVKNRDGVDFKSYYYDYLYKQMTNEK